MDYRRLGRTGMQVSRIGLGMMSYGNRTQRQWHLDEEEALPIVRRAVEGGVTFFDTADMYDQGYSEVVTGRLLSRLFSSRDDYVLATKVYFPMGPGPNDRGLSRKHVFSAIDASLTRLGTDFVDLYQIHRWDYETPIEETMTALSEVVRAGKARYIGASSMYAWQFCKAQAAAPIPFVSMQNRYNLVYREEEREMIPLCADQGVGVIPYSPLARGALAGSRKTARAGNDPLADDTNLESDQDVVDAVRKVAAEREVPPAQVALAWLLSKPAVTASILGATKMPHIEDALAAVSLTLTADEISALEMPYRPHRVLGHS
jgi:aryl-alcohol dehydrogenase-like predicted oxidoreductase